ncbi:MAG TPA: alpha/beta hydrolase [Burkholderiaceae bacterium]|nr:alpha/beta hydrolase [Burkholderiaceae bacterium]
MCCRKSLFLAAGAALLLSGCGGGSSTVAANTSSAEGALIFNPPFRVASVTAAEFAANLGTTPTGVALLTVSGPPVCGIDFYRIQYYTVGGAGESTTADGALMVPTGLLCEGKQSIVLYAHGTASTKSYDIADPTTTTNEGSAESALLAAMFAAHGYIVVAPNYAGYDLSSLPYHPFLIASQQSKDMMDALAAARSALGSIAATGDNGKLFVTGYSQGGHVAMATVRALQAAGKPPTASAPMSGPYATAAFIDAIFYGDVNLGSTEFFPLIISGGQHTYNNLYTSTSDIFEAAYANGIDSLEPGPVPFSTLVAEGKLPLTYLFNSTPPSTGNAQLDGLFVAITPPMTPAAEAPLFALGFGPTNLVKNSYRVGFIEDALAHPDGVVPTVTNGLPNASALHPLRQAAVKSDMRTAWAPMTPMLLCGGNADPTVFYSLNTQTMQSYWAPVLTGAAAALLTVLDVDSPPSGPTDPFAAAKVGFATAKATVFAAGGQNAVVQNYHGTLVPPFCTASARGFFSQF